MIGSYLDHVHNIFKVIDVLEFFKLRWGFWWVKYINHCMACGSRGPWKPRCRQMDVMEPQRRGLPNPNLLAVAVGFLQEVGIYIISYIYVYIYLLYIIIYLYYIFIFINREKVLSNIYMCRWTLYIHTYVYTLMCVYTVLIQPQLSN